jgi:hypothetical protein
MSASPFWEALRPRKAKAADTNTMLFALSRPLMRSPCDPSPKSKMLLKYLPNQVGNWRKSSITVNFSDEEGDDDGEGGDNDG